MKKGFGILTAIIFLVVIGTIGTLALSISTSTTKQTSDIFLREQAELLAQSANEYAMLAYTGHDRTSNCLQEIVAYYPNDQASAFFKITMKFKYFLEDATSKSYTNATCPSANVANITNTGTRAANLATNESEWSFILDTTVETIDNVTTEPIRIHRRTIQKP